MDQTVRAHHGRETSERLQRRLIYAFVNRVNIFKSYYKTPEEKLKLKRTKTEHKKALKQHYGSGYNRKIMNLPQFTYEITTAHG